ncbi:serine/threonine-protein kinase [Tomitella biformata]|uniref:serine/threonine-protein kinase n=1 Tax=Tomitella biformata TaxID=630403 RepID=UPI000465E675|nr:serine/threonine-protein kinase [Tomitella biformata]
MALQSGATIADRYRLQRHIATGGMGAVWESMDLRLDRAVAVKVLKPEYSDDPEFLERFRAEARTTAKLNHPGIANVYDYGETTDPNGSSIPYLVMELVRGEALNAVIRRMGVIPVDLALDMLEQSGRALHVAHQAGLVHRDVKPGNILVTPTGQVKITDFGIAKAVDAAPVTRTGMVMGTAQYIAPEQAMGQEATAASDVYSLGIVGYEVLGGRRPFQADSTFAIAQAHINDTPAPLPNTIPANVRELIDYTLTKDPAQRYPDGGAFADAVAAVRAGRRPPPPVGASMVAARAADAPATAMISSAQMRADQYRPPVDTGYPDDAPSGMSKGQKNLAITAGILLLLAAMIAGGIVLANLPQSATVDKTPATPTRTTTSAVPTTTRTTPPPRTTSQAPTTTSSPTSTEPTTTRETPTTTRSTTTTTQPTTTEPSTTSTSTSPSSSASSSSATGAMFNIQGAQAPRGATGYSDEMPAGHTPAYDGEQ